MSNHQPLQRLDQDLFDRVAREALEAQRLVNKLRALFTGWTAAVCRAFPANAGLFAGVELTSRLLQSV